MKFEKSKEIEEISCVYGIYNIKTKKWYIGSTINLKNRINRHLFELKKEKHHSNKLQRSFILYGPKNFELFILKNIEKDKVKDLSKEEDLYIKKLDSVENGYNISLNTNNPHIVKLSKIQIDKAANSHKISIIALDFNGNFIKRYSSITEASKELNTSSSNISQCCKNNGNITCKGFLFLYEKDYNVNKKYKRERYEMNKSHKNKIIYKAQTQKKARKINCIDNDLNFLSISEFENYFKMRKDSLREKIKITKNEMYFTWNSMNFILSKSNSKI